MLKRVILGLLLLIMSHGKAITARELLVQVDRLLLHSEKMPVHPFLTGKIFARILFFKQSMYVKILDVSISAEVVRSLFLAPVSERFVEDALAEFAKFTEKAAAFFRFKAYPYKILEKIALWFIGAALSEYFSKALCKESFAQRQKRSLRRAHALTEKEKAEVVLNNFFLRFGTRSWQVLLGDWEVAA